MTIKNELGYIEISPEVMAGIAGHAATGCFGVKGMTIRSVSDGLAHLLRRENMSRGVRITEAPTPIIPVHTRDTVTTLRVAKTLYERGVFVNPVLPPATSPDDCLLRVSLMASHTEALLDEAADIIARTLAEEGLLDEA